MIGSSTLDFGDDLHVPLQTFSDFNVAFVLAECSIIFLAPPHLRGHGRRWPLSWHPRRARLDVTADREFSGRVTATMVRHSGLPPGEPSSKAEYGNRRVEVHLEGDHVWHLAWTEGRV